MPVCHSEERSDVGILIKNKIATATSCPRNDKEAQDDTMCHFKSAE